MEETQFGYKDFKKSVLHMALNWFRKIILMFELQNDIQKHKEHNTHFKNVLVRQPKKPRAFRRPIH